MYEPTEYSTAERIKNDRAKRELIFWNARDVLPGVFVIVFMSMMLIAIIDIYVLTLDDGIRIVHKSTAKVPASA